MASMRSMGVRARWARQRACSRRSARLRSVSKNHSIMYPSSVGSILTAATPLPWGNGVAGCSADQTRASSRWAGTPSTRTTFATEAAGKDASTRVAPDGSTVVKV